MAVACPNCGQTDQMQAQFDTWKCHDCGYRSDFGGNLVDDGTNGTTNIVGNYADLQRMGQQVLAGGDTKAAFMPPPGVSEDEAKEQTKKDLKAQLTDGTSNTPTDEKALAKKEADEEAAREESRPKGTGARAKAKASSK